MSNEVNNKYSWHPGKREQNIKERGLDFVELADDVFADPNVVIKLDTCGEYGEIRFLAYALVGGKRLCLCFTPRGRLVHLVTIFRVNEKRWRKYYG